MAVIRGRNSLGVQRQQFLTGLITPGFSSVPRIKKFSNNAGSSGGIVNIYTVPAGKRAVLKAVRVANSTSGTDFSWALYHRRGTDALAANRTVYRDSGLELDLALPLEAGQTIGHAHGGTSAGIMHTHIWVEEHDDPAVIAIVTDNNGPGTSRTFQNNSGITGDPRRYLWTTYFYSDSGGQKWIRLRSSGNPIWQTTLGANEAVTIPLMEVSAFESVDVNYTGGVGNLMSAAIGIPMTDLA